MSITYAGKPVVDPKPLYEACEALGVPTGYWYDRANLFDCPRGFAPGTGAVLMSWTALEPIDKTVSQSLVFKDNVGNSVTLQKISVIKYVCVVPSSAANPANCFLVHLADRRHEISLIPISKAYNVRESTSSFFTATRNSGSDWTWQTMFADAWNLLGIGTAPSLPFTPDGTPENFDFYGGYAWKAVEAILTRIGCTVAYDPVADTFTVYRLGTTTGTDGTTAADGAGVKCWDDYSARTFRGTKPEKLRVTFLRFPAPSTGADPYYTVDATNTGSGIVTGSILRIHDDMNAIGATGTPSNTSALNSRATERAADWNRMYDACDFEAMRQYRGYSPNLVKAVGPKYAGVAFEDRGAGTRSQAITKPVGIFQPPPRLVAPPASVKSGFGAFSTGSFVGGSGAAVYVPPSGTDCLWLPSISNAGSYTNPAGSESFPYWNVVCSIGAYFATLEKLADTRYEVRGVLQYLDGSNVWQDVDFFVMFNASEYKRTVTIGPDSVDVYHSSGPGFFNDDTYSTYGGNWTTNVGVLARGLHPDPNGGPLYGVYVRPAVLVHVATGAWYVSFLGRITAFRTFNQDAVMATP